MKKTLIVFILSSLIGYSQSTKIPNIEWRVEGESLNIFTDILKISDKNSLIIRFGYSSYWSKGLNANYIVYHNNGKVEYFEAYHPNSLSNSKKSIKRKRIKKREYKYYWEYLIKCSTENKFNIDNSKLNITSMKGKEKGTMIVKSVSDGANYIFGIYQGKNNSTFSSYSPNTFIEDKFPGYEERQKLVDIMEGFEHLIETY